MPERSIWDKVDISIVSAEAQPAPSESSPGDRPRLPRLPFWLMDLIAGLAWAFVVIKLFIADIDREFIEAVAPSATWLVDYRFFLYLGLAVILAVTIRGPFWFAVGYIAFFPLVLIVWKIPRAIYRSGSWIVFLAVLNAVASFFNNFRLNFVSKALAVFAILGISLSTSPVIVVPAASYLAGLLAVTYFRIVRNSFSFSRFLRLQQNLIVRTLESKVVLQMTSLDETLKSDAIVKFDSAQLEKFSQSLGWGVLANYVIYFWAYQLEQYRQSPATVLFNALSYVWLFVLTVLTFTMLNLAVIHISPEQFGFADLPSTLRVILYSMSSLFLSGVSGLEAVGDWAVGIKIAAGFAGPIFLGTLGLHLLFSARPSRKDAEFSATIASIRRKAGDVEARLSADFEVSAEEALRRLAELGHFAVSWCLFFTKRMPDDFVGDDDAVSQ